MSKPHPSPNGKVPVVLNARYGKNNPGETCGFSPVIAERLVTKGFARYYEPPKTSKKRGGSAAPAAASTPAEEPAES